MYKECLYCRNCGGELETVIDLGNIAPSNFVEGDSAYTKVPLILSRCETCNLVQLKHTVDLDLMYRKYWYKSGINSEMKEHLSDLVRDIETIVKLERGDVFVDIGCNDGTMLTFVNPITLKVGFDPAYNLAEQAKKNCSIFINNYFDSVYYPVHYKAKVVTAIAMIYDLPDPNKFLNDVYDILADDGIFVVQFADLYSMLTTNDFPTICHEHIEYYDLSTLYGMLCKHDFSLFRVDRNNVNGGSLRLYIDKGKRDIEPSVVEELNKESEYFTSQDQFVEFAKRILSIGDKVYDFIRSQKELGKSISVLGASTKGNTILQYFGIDDTLIDYAADSNRAKWGLETIGTGIEIQGDEFVFSKNPDFMLILPWFFANNFIDKYTYYIESGGTFIIPMPEPGIFNYNGWTAL